MKQVVVITGLGDGMGREVAKMLVAAGDSVAGFDVDKKGVASLEKELAAIGGDHYLESLDITD
ncbi:MAG: SDR family NAD(P)-dependent oxidoreductase, partial [Spirochaetales bacterium]